MTPQHTDRNDHDDKGDKDDQDIHKGAVEGDRPNDQQNGNPQGSGVDTNGMPNEPVKTAQDREGANADETQG